MEKNKVDLLLKTGKITPDQARTLMGKVPSPQMEIIQAPRKPPTALAHIVHGLGGAFDHNRADEHYETRMDLEEGVRHIIGLPCYGFIAAVDAVLDAIGFGATEIVEDITFTASRTIFRARDGWQRGQIK